MEPIAAEVYFDIINAYGHATLIMNNKHWLITGNCMVFDE